MLHLILWLRLFYRRPFIDPPRSLVHLRIDVEQFRRFVKFNTNSPRSRSRLIYVSASSLHRTCPPIACIFVMEQNQRHGRVLSSITEIRRIQTQVQRMNFKSRRRGPPRSLSGRSELKRSMSVPAVKFAAPPTAAGSTDQRSALLFHEGVNLC